MQEFIQDFAAYRRHCLEQQKQAGWEEILQNPAVVGALGGGAIGGISGLFSNTPGAVLRNTLIGAGLGGLGGYGYGALSGYGEPSEGAPPAGEAPSAAPAAPEVAAAPVSKAQQAIDELKKMRQGLKSPSMFEDPAAHTAFRSQREKLDQAISKHREILAPKNPQVGGMGRGVANFVKNVPQALEGLNNFHRNGLNRAGELLTGPVRSSWRAAQTFGRGATNVAKEFSAGLGPHGEDLKPQYQSQQDDIDRRIKELEAP